jgi:dihydroxy-acid dehydratase
MTTAGDDGRARFVSENPGRDVQRVGTARFLGEDVSKIHDPAWGVIGTLGESQCYLGVQAKVTAVQAAMAKRVHDDDLAVRLVAPVFTLGCPTVSSTARTECATR